MHTYVDGSNAACPASSLPFPHAFNTSQPGTHHLLPAGVLCIGSFLSIAIALNNLSLMDISLSLNQIIRCLVARPGCWWWGRRALMQTAAAAPCMLPPSLYLPLPIACPPAATGHPSQS